MLNSILIFLIKVYIHTPFYNALVNQNVKKALDLRWYSQYGKWFNWDNPIDLNEKIVWLEGCSETSTWTRLADKYRVRRYVEEKGYPDCLPKLYGVWDSVEDIDFEMLPDRFVIKCNHDCHSTIVVKDKSITDIKSIKRKIKKCLNTKFGYSNCEPHYTKIKPRVMAEELIENSLPEISSSIVDYKIWCFGGKPYSIMTLHNRNHKSIRFDVYDINWIRHPEYCKYNEDFMDGNGEIPKPSSFEKMLEVSSRLSEGFPEVRVDFYDVNGKVYFGEMTFTSGAGRMPYYTPAYLKKMGSMVSLKDTAHDASH